MTGASVFLNMGHEPANKLLVKCLQFADGEAIVWERKEAKGERDRGTKGTTAKDWGLDTLLKRVSDETN